MTVAELIALLSAPDVDPNLEVAVLTHCCVERPEGIDVSAIPGSVTLSAYNPSRRPPEPLPEAPAGGFT